MHSTRFTEAMEILPSSPETRQAHRLQSLLSLARPLQIHLTIAFRKVLLVSIGLTR